MKVNMIIWDIFLLMVLLNNVATQKEKGHCVTYNSCDTDPGSDVPIPCIYDGDPIPINDSLAIDILNEYCPDLILGSDYSTCCNAAQVNIFKMQFDILATFFRRCPSCFHNLANVFCQQTCSPNQSLFLKVTKFNTTTKAVDEMSYYITEFYAEALFNSCKNVQMGFTSSPAIMVTCGGDPNCSPHEWLQYMGRRDPSPFQINFQFEFNDNITNINGTFFPMNTTVIPCSQPVKPGGTPCSCVDCPCNVPPPDGYISPNLKLFGIALVDAIMIIIYLVLAVTIICGFIVIHYYKKREKDDELLIPNDSNLKEKHCWEMLGIQMDDGLKKIFTKWATFCASHPISVLFVGLFFIILFSCGIVYFTVTINPVDLWSAPHSQAREEKDYFDKHFGPFYRTEQVIITRKSDSPVVGTNLTFSSVFDRDFLHMILDLQTKITSLTANVGNSTIYFKDICFAPVTTSKCMIQSAVNWFQDEHSHIDYFSNIDEYLKHLNDCTKNPYLMQKEPALSCIGDYGGPIFPYIVLGGVEDGNYANASALIITFMVKNNLKEEDNVNATSWEAKFIEFLKNYNNSEIEFAFSSERSIQDELNRESYSDVKTIFISYLVMFAYISISLGQYSSFTSLFVKSKMILGLGGILIVLASVLSSIGIFSYLKIPATLIIIEVIPFLVLAVGVDNIFIMVQSYQRSKRHELETREQHIGRVIGQISPSLLLASLSESSCFFLGGLSSMPAVHIFALYSGLALLIDFLLQISCFVALLSLDSKREETGRLDVCCCIKLSDSNRPKQKDDFLYALFDKYYAPFLMKNYIRCIVLLIFTGWICLSIAVISKIEVGLDQQLSMPKDSYVLKYFSALAQYLSVGPPVYFVIKSGYNYSDIDQQNALCIAPNCHRDSLVAKISNAAKFANKTYIADQPLDWLDTYISWANDQTGCCRVDINDPTKFCPSNSTNCRGCDITDVNFRPKPDKFNTFLLDFLNENPSPDCPVGGHASFANAIEILPNVSIGATHYMTYHTVLKTSDDFTEALRWARIIANNLTQTLSLLNNNSSDLNSSIPSSNIQVFPYSIFYVFYEQYLYISKDTVINLIISILSIFVVTLLLMGLDFHSSLIMILTILLIIHDLMGLMYFWNISLNAVSLVNLVMAVGISVEFCSHIIRAFAFHPHGSKIERAQKAVAHMGSSVLSGITLTKFAGILVLAFSKSQIFQIFYFRMYLGIVLIGAAHGLIFLPVFLSIIGPPVKHKIAKENECAIKSFSQVSEKESDIDDSHIIK